MLSGGRFLLNKEKAKDIAVDATASAVESGAEIAVDNLPALASVVKEVGLEGAAAVLADGIVGAVAPGALGLVVNYKLRRAERNVGRLIAELSQDMVEINRRLDSLESDKRAKFTEGSYRDALLDAIIEEVEPSKIQGAINAFLNFMSEDVAGDSSVLTFFDDLSRLNALDLRVLRLHGSPFIIGYEVDDDRARLLSEEGIDDLQYRSIREKLCRFGLLQSKNEEKRDKNLEAVQACLVELVKQLSSKKAPRIPKVPKIQKLSMSDSFSITSLGNRYLRLMGPVVEEG